MYTVRVGPRAQRQLDDLSASLRARITQRLLRLRTNPRPPGVKKLRAMTETYRLRIGGYRVKFSIDDKERTVTIVEIVHRRDAY